MLNIQIFPFNPFSENTYIIYNDNKTGYIIDPEIGTTEKPKLYKNL